MLFVGGWAGTTHRRSRRRALVSGFGEPDIRTSESGGGRREKSSPRRRGEKGSGDQARLGSRADVIPLNVE